MGMDMGAHIVYIDDIDVDVEVVRVGIDIDDTDIDDLDTDRWYRNNCIDDTDVGLGFLGECP